MLGNPRKLSIRSALAILGLRSDSPRTSIFFFRIVAVIAAERPAGPLPTIMISYQPWIIPPVK